MFGGASQRLCSNILSFRHYLYLRIKNTQRLQVCKIVHHKDVSAEGIIIIFCMMTAIIVAIKMHNVYLHGVCCCWRHCETRKSISLPTYFLKCLYICVPVRAQKVYVHYSNNCVVYGWWWKMIWTLWTYQIRFSFQEIVMTFLKGIWYV